MSRVLKVRAPFQRTNGPIAQITGHGYRGQAQNDAPSADQPAPDQASAQVISGNVVVRVEVTYQDQALSQVSQLPEVTALAGRAGRRLARSR